MRYPWNLSWPNRKYSRKIQFFSLVTCLVIKCQNFTGLPVPQPVIDHVTHFAHNNGVSRDLVFADGHHIPFAWPDNDCPTSLDPTPMRMYPDIPADMPGVLIDRSTMGVPSMMTNPTLNPTGLPLPMLLCKMLIWTLHYIFPCHLKSLLLMMKITTPLFLTCSAQWFNIFQRLNPRIHPRSWPPSDGDSTPGPYTLIPPMCPSST